MIPSPPCLSSRYVFFDFDGTLARGDSGWHFLLFCFRRRNIKPVLGAVYQILKDLLAGKKDRNRFKEYLFGSIMRGLSAAEIENFSRNFSEKYFQESRFFPQALQRLKAHQAAGDECVLVSASLGEYLKIWALQNGFKVVLATQLEIGADQCATGRFQAGNCYGGEKLKRILAYLQSPAIPKASAAYGNSAGDYEMLEAVLKSGGESWFVLPCGKIEPWAGRILDKNKAGKV